MADNTRNGLTYADAGVDIDAGNAMVDAIKPLVQPDQAQMQSLAGSAGCSISKPRASKIQFWSRPMMASAPR